MNMRRLLAVMVPISMVATTAVVVVAARGCVVDRAADGWPDNEGLHKDPHAEAVSEAKQELIDHVLLLQQRADALRQRAEAQLGEDAPIARDLSDVRARLNDAERQIATLTTSGPNSVMHEGSRIEDHLSLLDDILDRAEQALDS